VRSPRRFSSLLEGELLSIWGIDVSNHQGGSIDWGAARAGGIQFAWAKVCEGSGYRDPDWAGNRDRALAAGVAIGGYGYVHPNGDAVQQANFFCDLHGPMLRGMLPPAIDLEEANGVGPAGVHAWARVWLDTVGARLGVTPAIYTYPDFWANAVACPPNCQHCGPHPLWYASYHKPPAPNPPHPWDKITVWQYDGTGTYVPGVGPGNDANWFLGTGTELEALTYGAAPVPLEPDQEDDKMRLVTTVEDGAVWALVEGQDPHHLTPDEFDAVLACGVKPPVTVNSLQKDRFGALINSAGK
jgi:lysozyme